MRPLLHPVLVNGRFGDPAVFVETLFERRAILFDLGDIAALPARSVLKVDQVFVSHTHLDHFFGFDRLLRLLVGRAKSVALYGPGGFLAQVHHKLQAYQWNLVHGYADDLVFLAHELAAPGVLRRARFRLKTAFAREEQGETRMAEDVLHEEARYRIRVAVLEHRVPCLAFALEETAHVNVWKTRLDALGLPVGPWLRELKQAIVAGLPDDTPIDVRAAASEAAVTTLPLGELRRLVTLTSGQKIAYVTDAADSPANRAAIEHLVRGADLLMIEATFAAADAALAAARTHLTTKAAGEIGRAARVRRVEPFHFSPRYADREADMLAEVQTAFAGTTVPSIASAVGG
jgi:ribonuclease Z